MLTFLPSYCFGAGITGLNLKCVITSCIYYTHSIALTFIFTFRKSVHMYYFIDFNSEKIILLKSSPIVIVFILGITDEHSHGLVGFSLNLYIMPAYS